VKFDEFAHYVVDEARRGYEEMDKHWRPQYRLCQPCHIDYDFVGHHETIRRDAGHVIRQIARHGDGAEVPFPSADVDSPESNADESLRPFYENVSALKIRQLLRLYRRDYAAFDYKIPEEIRRILRQRSG